MGQSHGFAPNLEREISPTTKAGLSDHASLELMQQLLRYAHLAKRLGYRNPAWSEKALSQLALIPAGKKFEIARFLQLCSQWAEQCGYDDLAINEKSFLKAALNHYGLQVDDNLFNTIDQDTVIEIYNENMVQLFRSFKLLNMTAYSLMDLSVFEWFVLWQRPNLVIQQMQNIISQVLQFEVPSRKFEVTPHLLKETFNTGLTEPFVPKSAFVSFQHIGFLKRLNDDAPRAFICTGKGTIMTEGFADTNQFAFL